MSATVSLGPGSPLARPRELTVSAAWNGGLARELTTEDGARVHVIHPGNWSHGQGPDFLDARLDIDGALVVGAVELHLQASDWYRHGHHLNPAYDDVVLHIVCTDDTDETRTANGRRVPVACLDVPDSVLFSIDRRLPEVWDDLGGSICAATSSANDPASVRRAIQQLGDDRLRARAAIAAGDMTLSTPSDVLFRGVMDALGYSQNRGPMRQLADALIALGMPGRCAGSSGQPDVDTLASAMLGIAGYLPLSPLDASIGGILPEDGRRFERLWERSGLADAIDPVPATAWELARTRPANHPVTRIMQAVALLVSLHDDLLSTVVTVIGEGVDPVSWLQRATSRGAHPGLGRSRATAIVASVILPAIMAVASDQRDADLEDAAWRAWTRLPLGEWTRPAKRAMAQVSGSIRIGKLGERGHQGLLHLDRHLCTPRRCHECPVAALVVRDRLVNQADDASLGEWSPPYDQAEPALA